MRPIPVVRAALVLIASILPALAQEMEPRAYSPSPVGANFVAAFLGRLSGDVLFDASIPLTNVEAEIDVLTLGYGRSFGLWGKQGLVTVAVPYAVARVEGDVEEEAQRVRRSGFGDMRVRASLNLLGSNAMTPAEFVKAPRRPILGASVTVQAPVGEYEPSKLINLGTNRWAVKPEIGASFPVGGWSFDAYAGVWFFANNDAFYPGASTKRQDPLPALQLHVSYTFRSHIWLALDGTWYGGGETTIDGGPPSNRFDNTRLGGTLSIPITRGQSIKMSASEGASARTGSDFTAYGVAWQMVWFSRSASSAPRASPSEGPGGR